MNCFSRTLLLIAASLLSVVHCFAQETGSLMVDGIVTSAGKPVDGAEVKIFRDKGKLLYRTTNSAGKFKAKLELGAEYVISAGLPGSTTKTFNFITEVPKGKENNTFTKQIEIDLNPLTADAKGKKKWEQSAGGVLYKESEGGFVTVNYDLDEWKKQMAEAAERERLRKLAEEKARAEAEKRRLEAEELARQEQAKRDAENALLLAAQAKEKAKQDSLAAVQAHLAKMMEKRKQEENLKKTEEEKLNELAKAEQARKKAEAEKLVRQQFIADSIANAKTEAIRLAAAEKTRKEAEAEAMKKADKAREKAVADSIANARAQEKLLLERQKAQEKATADSLLAVEKAKKQKEEAEKLKALEEKKVREKAIADSITTAKLEQKRLEDEAKARFKAEEAAKIEAERKQREAEEQARIKAEQERKAKEEADRLAKLEADRKAQEEADRKTKEEKERILAEKAEREKQEAERIAAEIKAKEEEAVRKKEEAAKALYELRKNNSYKEETVKETGKTILVTTVKIDGVQTTYKKLTHDWGGVFYYKNGADISDALYLQELKNAKEQMNPE